MAAVKSSVSLEGCLNRRPNAELALDMEAIGQVQQFVSSRAITTNLALSHVNALSRAIISLCTSCSNEPIVRDMQGRVCRKITGAVQDANWQALVPVQNDHPSIYEWMQQKDNSILLTLGVGVLCYAGNPMHRNILQVRCSKGRLLCDSTRALFDCSGVLIGESCVFSVHLKTLERAVEWEGFDHKISSMLGLFMT